MEENQQSEALCRNVFKNGKSTTTELEYTKVWTLLINTLERDKCAASVPK